MLINLKTLGEAALRGDTFAVADFKTAIRHTSPEGIDNHALDVLAKIILGEDH